MQNTVYYKGDLVSAQFSGHHRPVFQNPFEKLYKLSINLTERDLFLYIVV